MVSTEPTEVVGHVIETSEIGVVYVPARICNVSPAELPAMALLLIFAPK